MSRRTKKRSVEPEIRAAEINAQAAVKSAEIQAKGAHRNALIAATGAVVVALVAGLCTVTNTAITALPHVIVGPEPATTTAGPTPARAPGAPSTTQTLTLEQHLAKLDAYVDKARPEDCLRYPREDDRRYCWNEKLQALGFANKARADLLDVRDPGEGTMVRIS
ncbi:hypothetical protein [Micromonospora tulbaghiae]|uniref:hypothetical protein n=1 Tax=Micromonospora tulbaghiae TaxID=479978 RepID=UPI00371D68B2